MECYSKFSTKREATGSNESTVADNRKEGRAGRKSALCLAALLSDSAGFFPSGAWQSLSPILAKKLELS